MSKITVANQTQGKRRQRRSRSTIARHKRANAAKKAERERLRAEKQAQWEAGYPLRAARYQREHDKRLAYERDRAGKRRLMYAYLDYSFGYDTPEARVVAAFVAQNEGIIRGEAAAKAKAADLLGLLADQKPLTKREKKAQERKAEEERLARGERHELIPDPDNPRQNVVVKSLSHSFRRVRMKIHQEPAAEKFVLDWESASYSGLSSQGFDPKVDSSAKETMGHIRAAEAQRRLQMAEKQIGERNYQICVGVLIHNANPTTIHAFGGRDHRTVSNDIDVALNALAGFYDPVRLARDPTWLAFQKLIEAGRAVINKLEDEVR